MGLDPPLSAHDNQLPKLTLYQRVLGDHRRGCGGPRRHATSAFPRLRKFRRTGLPHCSQVRKSGAFLTSAMLPKAEVRVPRTSALRPSAEVRASPSDFAAVHLARWSRAVPARDASLCAVAKIIGASLTSAAGVLRCSKEGRFKIFPAPHRIGVPAAGCGGARGCRELVAASRRRHPAHTGLCPILARLLDRQLLAGLVAGRHGGMSVNGGPELYPSLRRGILGEHMRSIRVVDFEPGSRCCLLCEKVEPECVRRDAGAALEPGIPCPVRD